METNDQGQVALAYCQTIPHNVRIGETKTYYSFIVKANLCMCWINPEHVDIVLNTKRRNCHCGNRNPSKKEYRYANESDVRRWTNGGGR
jgi:hypothetical protein